MAQVVEALAGESGPGLGTPARVAKGVGGEVEQRVIDAEVSYLDRVFASRIFAIEMERPVLGRNDFMSTFDVQFVRGANPPEFHVGLNARFGKKKNLALWPRRR